MKQIAPKPASTRAGIKYDESKASRSNKNEARNKQSKAVITGIIGIRLASSKEDFQIRDNKIILLEML